MFVCVCASVCVCDITVIFLGLISRLKNNSKYFIKNVFTMRRNKFIGAWKKNVFIKEQSKGNSNL